MPRGKGNKLYRHRRARRPVERSELMTAVAVVPPGASLVVWSGERTKTLDWRDLQDYLGERAQRGAVLSVAGRAASSAWTRTISARRHGCCTASCAGADAPHCASVSDLRQHHLFGLVDEIALDVLHAESATAPPWCWRPRRARPIVCIRRLRPPPPAPARAAAAAGLAASPWISVPSILTKSSGSEAISRCESRPAPKSSIAN